MQRGMLVIKRRRNEELYVFTPDGERVRVVILGSTPSMVTLGIAAPLSVRVERPEVNARRMLAQTGG